MFQTKRNSRWWFLVLVLVIAFGSPVTAQQEVPWWTVDGGGQTSSGGSFEVTGTIGQPDAGEMSGGTSTVSGGFWSSENPFVPVELLFFEISDGRSESSDADRGKDIRASAEQVSCRVDDPNPPDDQRPTKRETR
ncbi:MAG: hypothetical protein V3T72_23460 [Thermoanaerobaculia bacterium]